MKRLVAILLAFLAAPVLADTQGPPEVKVTAGGPAVSATYTCAEFVFQVRCIRPDLFDGRATVADKTVTLEVTGKAAGTGYVVIGTGDELVVVTVTVAPAPPAPPPPMPIPPVVTPRPVGPAPAPTPAPTPAPAPPPDPPAAHPATPPPTVAPAIPRGRPVPVQPAPPPKGMTRSEIPGPFGSRSTWACRPTTPATTARAAGPTSTSSPGSTPTAPTPTLAGGVVLLGGTGRAGSSDCPTGTG
jgi:outer membrane biosynthesis protein TonB